MDKKYNNWTIIDDKQYKKGTGLYIKCRCDCGMIKGVRIKNLKSGQSKSCGCIGKKKITERNTKHNQRFTKTWRAWQSMKTRCYNKNIKQYHNYGGRGIRVCDRWLNSFEDFYEDMGESPENKSLDRIHNNKGYSKDNCKWSTYKQQCKNKNNNRKINGVCISEISKSLGGGHSLVAKRLKIGWSIERAITEKTNAKKQDTKYSTVKI